MKAPGRAIAYQWKHDLAVEHRNDIKMKRTRRPHCHLPRVIQQPRYGAACVHAS